MAFRIVTIKNRCKLEYSLNYLICRNQNETKILLDEISTLIIQSTEVAITTALISNLAKRNIKVLFCDEKSNPESQLMPIYGTNDSFKKIEIQQNWNKKIKSILWKEIIKQKIFNQMRNLETINIDNYNKLKFYYENVEENDISNREGHAAKVYFNSLFGKDFARYLKNDTNKYLNYGYSILLSSINREIKSLGYLTEIGIHHIGKTNPFNLSCDFIEPLRPLVDHMVIKKIVNEDNFKKEFVNLLNKKVIFMKNEMFLENAIKSYVTNLLNNLKNNTYDFEFIYYEF